MMDENHKPPAPETPLANTQARRPYKKPAFEAEEIFETMALSCGKINPTEGSCHQVRKNS
jgi:hypothetical protein